MDFNTFLRVRGLGDRASYSIRDLETAFYDGLESGRIPVLMKVNGARVEDVTNEAVRTVLAIANKYVYTSFFNFEHEMTTPLHMMLDDESIGSLLVRVLAETGCSVLYSRALTLQSMAEALRAHLLRVGRLSNMSISTDGKVTAVLEIEDKETQDLITNSVPVTVSMGARIAEPEENTHLRIRREVAEIIQSHGHDVMVLVTDTLEQLGIYEYADVLELQEELESKFGIMYPDFSALKTVQQIITETAQLLEEA